MREAVDDVEARGARRRSRPARPGRSRRRGRRRRRWLASGRLPVVMRGGPRVRRLVGVRSGSTRSQVTPASAHSFGMRGYAGVGDQGGDPLHRQERVGTEPFDLRGVEDPVDLAADGGHRLLGAGLLGGEVEQAALEAEADDAEEPLVDLAAALEDVAEEADHRLAGPSQDAAGHDHGRAGLLEQEGRGAQSVGDDGEGRDVDELVGQVEAGGRGVHGDDVAGADQLRGALAMARLALAATRCRNSKAPSSERWATRAPPRIRRSIERRSRFSRSLRMVTVETPNRLLSAPTSTRPCSSRSTRMACSRSNSLSDATRPPSLVCATPSTAERKGT